MSQSFYKRNFTNQYGGGSSSDAGGQANAMGYLVAGFMRLAAWLSVQFCLEQPSSSSLEKFPPIQKAFQMTGAACFRFHMGAFDDNLGCQKCMKVLTNSRLGEELQEVRRYQTAARPDIYRHDLGGVTGGPGLRETAHYPKAFAEYILQRWISSRGEVLQTWTNWRDVMAECESDSAARVFFQCLE